MIRGRIVGLGQPLAGDDGVGPAIIEHLRRSPLPAGVSLEVMREPTGLVPLLDELGTRLVIVDAVLSEPAGEVLDLDGGELEVRGLASVSSHGISVGQALALARATSPGGRLAAEVRLIAVAIARPVRGAQALSPAVAASIPRAARLALEWATPTGGE